jgi:nitrate reductase NapA
MSAAINTRRDFIKKMAMLSAMTAAATMFPGIIFAEEQEKGIPNNENLDWKKGPCRFCGVGCGILVGVENGKAVAVKGDPNSSVNKGLLCVKGYHQIMCIEAKDRLTHALVKKNGVYVKTPINEALDLVASKMKQTIEDHGKDSVAMYTSGQSTIPEGYVASKLMKGAIGI